MHDSTLFTIGTALRRAESNCMPVEVLVHGHWLSGNVAGVDGHGVVLTTPMEHSVIRLEDVSAVRVPERVAQPPVAEPFSDKHELVMTGGGDASWRMPGPAA